MQRRPASIRWLALLPVLLLATSTASAQLSWNIDYIDVTGNGGSGFPEGFNEPGGIGDQRRSTVASALDYIASQIADKFGGIQDAQQRQEAIAVALVWLVKFECHFGVRSGSNHPPTYDRLSRILAAFQPAPNELVWAISSTALHLHMHLAGFRTPAREFESFREFLSFLCDELSRRPLRL